MACAGVRDGDEPERKGSVQTVSVAAMLPYYSALDVGDRWEKLCGTGPPSWADLGAGRCSQPSFRSLSRRGARDETLNRCV